MKKYKVMMGDYEKPFLLTVEADRVELIKQNPDDKWGDDLVFYVDEAEVVHVSGTPTYWLADAGVGLEPLI